MLNKKLTEKEKEKCLKPPESVTKCFTLGKWLSQLGGVYIHLLYAIQKETHPEDQMFETKCDQQTFGTYPETNHFALENTQKTPPKGK